MNLKDSVIAKVIAEAIAVEEKVRLTITNYI